MWRDFETISENKQKYLNYKNIKKLSEMADYMDENNEAFNIYNKDFKLGQVLKDCFFIKTVKTIFLQVVLK